MYADVPGQVEEIRVAGGEIGLNQFDQEAEGRAYGQCRKTGNLPAAREWPQQECSLEKPEGDKAEHIQRKVGEK